MKEIKRINRALKWQKAEWRPETAPQLWVEPWEEKILGISWGKFTFRQRAQIGIIANREAVKIIKKVMQ